SLPRCVCSLFPPLLFSDLLLIPLPPRSPLFSLHDALPISVCSGTSPASPRPSPRTALRTSAPTSSGGGHASSPRRTARSRRVTRDRKSTRLNSSHVKISYAVFCLKKKKKITYTNKQIR